MCSEEDEDEEEDDDDDDDDDEEAFLLIGRSFLFFFPFSRDKRHFFNQDWRDNLKRSKFFIYT